MKPDLLTPPGQGDDGGADDTLIRALACDDDVDLPALVAALRQARVFVGVEARLTSSEATTGADKSSEMALATLRTPSGASALPIFSSIAALTAWRSSARPVPVAAADACAEAVRLGLDAVVIDVAGPSSASLDVGLFAPADTRGAAGPGPAGSPPVEHAGGRARSERPDQRDQRDQPDQADQADQAGDLRRPADPRGPLSRRRVRRALRTVTEDVLVWPAELVGPGGATPRPVLALAVRSAEADDAAAVAVIARRLGELLAVGAGPIEGPPAQSGQTVPAGPMVQSGPTALAGSTVPAGGSEPSGRRAMAVLVVASQEVPAVRRHLGRALRPGRRWPTRRSRR